MAGFLERGKKNYCEFYIIENARGCPALSVSDGLKGGFSSAPAFLIFYHREANYQLPPSSESAAYVILQYGAIYLGGFHATLGSVESV